LGEEITAGILIPRNLKRYNSKKLETLQSPVIRNVTIPSDQKHYHSKKSETLYTKYHGSADDGYNTDPITSSHYFILSTLNITLPLALYLISSLERCL